MANNTAEVRYALQYGQKFPTNAPLTITEPIVVKGFNGPPRIEPDIPGRRVQFLFEGIGDAPFIYKDTRDQYISGVDVFLTVACEAAFIFERVNVGSGVIPSSHAMLRDVRIYGNNIARRGIWYRVPLSDQNNEHGRYDDVTVYYVTDEALRIDGSQAKEHVLTNFRCEGAKVGIFSNSGSFTAIGGALHLCSDASVVLNNPTGAVTLVGVASETSNRFLRKSSGTADAQPVTLQNCTVMTDQLNADGVVIDFRSAGPLRVIGGQIGDGVQSHGKIKMASLGAAVLRVQDVAWKSWGSYEVKDTLIECTGDVGKGVSLFSEGNLFTKANGEVWIG